MNGEKRKKSKLTHPKRKNPLLFKGYGFVFDSSLNLSRKQREILEKIIEKHHGILNPTKDSIHTCIVLCTDSDLYIEERKKLMSLWEKDSIPCHFLQLSFVHQSAAQQQLMPIKDYSISSSSSKELVANEEIDTNAKTNNKQMTIDTDEEKEEEKHANLIEMAPYACQRATFECKPSDPNFALIQALEQVVLFYQMKGDYTRELAYYRVLGIIKALKIPLTSGFQLQKMQYIGNKMGEKLEIFLQNHHFGQLSTQIHEFQDQMKILKNFCGIYGVGLKTAQKWYNEGYRSIQGLQQAFEKKLLKHSFTSLQKLGLRYFFDIQMPITIQEKEEICQCIQNQMNTICSQAQILIAGGFRRGKTTGHDVDILIRIPSQHQGQEASFLQQLIEILQPTPLKCSLIESTMKYSSTSSFTIADSHPRAFTLFKFHPNQPYRRVDLVMIPSCEWGFAVLGWTGSQHFERSIRKYAKDHFNYHLNNHGLFDLKTGQSISIPLFQNPNPLILNSTIEKDSTIETDSTIDSLTTEEMEKAIFQSLKLEYRKPNERCV